MEESAPTNPLVTMTHLTPHRPEDVKSHQTSSSSIRKWSNFGFPATTSVVQYHPKLSSIFIGSKPFRRHTGHWFRSTTTKVLWLCQRSIPCAGISDGTIRTYGSSPIPSDQSSNKNVTSLTVGALHVIHHPSHPRFCLSHWNQKPPQDLWANTRQRNFYFGTSLGRRCPEYNTVGIHAQYWPQCNKCYTS